MNEQYYELDTVQTPTLPVTLAIAFSRNNAAGSERHVNACDFMQSCSVLQMNESYVLSERE